MAINNNIIGEANQPSPHGGEMVRGFKNVFVKPDEQNRACSSYAMARKRRMKSNIIFDLGRILVGLDNERCIAAFERVGLEKIAFYVREHRVEDLFLAAEVGDITTPQFCDEVLRARHRHHLGMERTAYGHTRREEGGPLGVAP